MTDLTDDQVKALLDGATPGRWAADGDPQNRIIWSPDGNRVCFMAHSSGLNDARDIATSNLIAAAPDLARALIASEAARKLAEERLREAVAQSDHVVAEWAEVSQTNYQRAKAAEAERDAALARVGDSLHWQSLHGWEPDEGTWAILWPGYYGPFTACWINGRWTMCEDHDFSHATVGAVFSLPHLAKNAILAEARDWLRKAGVGG